MPMHVGDLQLRSDYCIYYKKKNETIIVCAPDKEDAKELIEYIGDKTGLIPANP